VSSAPRLGKFFPLLAAAIALAVIYGWVFDVAWLLQPGRFSAATELMAAVVVLLSSVAMLAVLASRRGVVFAASGLAAAICIVNLGGNWLQADSILIDRWLRSPVVDDYLNPPGRMSSPSALTLLVLSLALPLLLLQARVWHQLVASVLGSIVAGYGLFALTGYVGQLLVGVGWGVLAGFSIPESVSAVLLGGGAVLLAWQGGPGARRVAVSRMAGGAALFASCVAVVVAIALEAREMEASQAEELLALEQLAAGLSSDTRQSRRAVERMAMRLESAPGMTESAWREDARAYIRDIPGLLLIVVTSPDGQVWREVGGASLGDAYVSFVLQQAERATPREESSAIDSIVDGPVSLPDGAAGILLAAFASRGGSSVLQVAGVIDPRAYFADLISGVLRQNHDVMIRSPSGVLFEHKTGEALDPLSFEYSTEIESGAGKWQLILGPTTAHVANERSRVSETLLLAGLVMANLLGLSVQLGRAAVTNAERLAESLTSLAEREERLASLFKSVLDGVLIVDVNGRIESANPAASTIFGCSSTELQGAAVEALFRGTGPVGDLKLETRRLAELAGLQWEGAGVRREGTEFPVSVSVSAFSTSLGRKFAWLVRDISERKSAERERQKLVDELEATNHQLALTARESAEAAERFTILFASVPDATLMVEEDGTIVEFNRQAEKLFEWTRDEIRGRPVEVLLPPGLRKTHVVQRTEFARNPEVRAMGSGRELEAVNRSGEAIPVEISLSPLRFQGRLMVVASIRDITERRKAEQAVAESEKRLRLANKELEGIVYVASHDLRSPLVNLQGFGRIVGESVTRLSELLQGAGLAPELDAQVAQLVSEEIPEALGFIESSTRKMDRLIRGLLNLSRLGRVVLHPARVDMNALVRDAVSAMQYVISKHDAKVEVQPLPECYMDADQLSQVVSNLLDNAIKYRAPGRPPVIRVGGAESHGVATYTFEDNGIGIAENHQGVIFDLFHRLNPKDGIDGDGLGLTAVRRILERSGGAIRVESRKGEGSRFIITVPATPTDNAESGRMEFNRDDPINSKEERSGTDHGNPAGRR
jgi:PAS domain S-box-containing protein